MSMTDMTSLCAKIEAAKASGLGITLDDAELNGLLSMATLLGTITPARDADPDEIITIAEICAKLKISRQTLYRWRRDGKFMPQPVNVQATRWLRSEFSQWLRERSA
jgi:predicted DNA-binding transcriptional regulator AlpA